MVAATAIVVPVRRRGGAGRRPLFRGAVTVVAGRDDETRRQALDIPVERSGKRLVEVVEIEDQTPVGRCERAEVRQVGISAALHAQCCRRRVREVPRHDPRGAAIEGERRDDHPAMPDRHQIGHARGVLLFEDGDRIRAGGRRRPLSVRVERHRLALRATLAHARLDRFGEVEHAARPFARFLRLRLRLR